jgi:hypothetical protein
VAVDFGRAKRRGILAHFHRHGHIDVEDIVNLFVHAGLMPTRTGALGMNDLNFVVARALGRHDEGENAALTVSRKAVILL